MTSSTPFAERIIKMKIAIGSDRRGYKCKTKLIEYLKKTGYEVIDTGPYDDTLPVDYPIYGERVGRAIISGKAQFGVIICATGNGILMAANKVKGIRCGMGYGDEVASLMRQHNDANVICFGQDYMAYEDIQRRLDIFLHTDFIGKYHCARIQQLADIENDIEITQTPMEKKF